MSVEKYVLFNYGDGADRLAPVLSAMDKYYTNTAGPTELCKIMSSENSDKGNGWHTYTQFYHALFGEIRERAKLLLEVGIGTNNVDVPSNMGAGGTPGASLRGWRNFFPNAEIIGADVDRGILFTEPRINTYYVDQLNSQTIEDLSRAIDGSPDIIIDDGLHTFAANSNLFSGIFHKVDRNGLYIIEDVGLEPDNVQKFNEFFSAQGVNGAFISLPCALNNLDNAVVVLFPS